MVSDAVRPQASPGSTHMPMPKSDLIALPSTIDGPVAWSHPPHSPLLRLTGQES